MRHRWIISAVLLGCLTASGLADGRGTLRRSPRARRRSRCLTSRLPRFEVARSIRGFSRRMRRFSNASKPGRSGCSSSAIRSRPAGRRNRELFDRSSVPISPPTSASAAIGRSTFSGGFANGELDISPPPKVVVLMIGTNNLRTDTVADIDKGTEAIVNRVRTKHPTTKVLLLGVLPMGVDPKDPMIAGLRQKVIEINERLKAFADGSSVVFLDFGDKLLNKDGTTSAAMRADGVHLEAARIRNLGRVDCAGTCGDDEIAGSAQEFRIPRRINEFVR